MSKKTMDYKLELFVKELELDKIRDKKNLAVKNMEYANAAHLRDLENEKEHEIQEILYNLLFNFYQHSGSFIISSGSFTCHAIDMHCTGDISYYQFLYVS